MKEVLEQPLLLKRSPFRGRGAAQSKDGATVWSIQTAKSFKPWLLPALFVKFIAREAILILTYSGLLKRKPLIALGPAEGDSDFCVRSAPLPVSYQQDV